MGRYVERVLWRWNPGEGDCGCASGMLLKKRKKFLRESLFKTYGEVRWRANAMRGYEEMQGRVVGWEAFFHPFCSFLRSCVCGKVQMAEGPKLKLAGEPVQGYGRDYEVLIVLFVYRFDGFY